MIRSAAFLFGLAVAVAVAMRVTALRVVIMICRMELRLVVFVT